MLTVFSLFLMLVPSGQAPSGQAPSVEQVLVIPGTPVVAFDLRTMDGDRLRQLAWSPDETELYLQTYDPNRDASVKAVYHYRIPVTGGAPEALAAPPTWVADYWAWKSGQAAPGNPSWKIDVSSEKTIASATSMPMGGDLARGGTVNPTSGTTAESVITHAAGSANLNTYTMRLNSQTVGEWINHPIMPGLTFGWGPTGSGLIAFADTKDGQLILMDASGATQRIDGTSHASLPAFTPSGSRVAYVEEQGRNKFSLVIAAVIVNR